MACLSEAYCTELGFVQALLGRSSEGECKGPSVTLALATARVLYLERIFDSQIATDVLWSGYEERGDDDLLYQVRFTLCAAHWFDLGAFAWARGYQKSRPDWINCGEELLQDLCREVAWDPKEIANLLAWRRTRLT